MSQIMKSFTGLFVVLLMVVVVTGMLGMFLEVADAQDFHAELVSEMQDCDFAASVMKDMYERAAGKGYALTVCLVQNEGVSTCPTAASLPSQISETAMVRVQLTYPVRLGFFGINKSRTISGYAR